MKKKLKEVCTFYSGTGFPTQYQGETEGDYPFYKVGDIANNATAGKVYLELCNNYIDDNVAKTIKGCILPKDTVVFAKIGEALKLNRRAITSCDCLIDNNAMGIAPKREALRIQYFYFLMKNLKMQTLAESTTVPSVRKTVLEDYEIEVPSIDEQEEIEKKLVLTQEIIEMRKKELIALDNLIKARFVELFGEYYMNHINEKQLDEICDFIDYRGKTPEKSESGIPLITAKNVKDNRFSIEPQEFIPEENYDDVMTRGIPRVNDVLFTTEAPLGNVCRIPDVYERFCVGQRLITMQPHTDVINSEYLEHALASAEFQEKMWQKSSGSTVKGIRSKLLVLLTIPVPPIELQNQFRDFVHQVDKSKVAVQKSLDESQQLFDSLMQRYFG